MDVLLWMIPVSGELYYNQIHSNPLLMAHMLFFVNKIGEFPICIWIFFFPHHVIYGNSMNSNDCGQIIDEFWLPLFPFLLWLQWTRRSLLSLCVILVNYLISDLFPVQRGVQLFDKHDFFHLNYDMIYWYVIKIFHPMK